jgi:hypothetical protein
LTLLASLDALTGLAAARLLASLAASLLLVVMDFSGGAFVSGHDYDIYYTPDFNVWPYG